MGMDRGVFFPLIRNGLFKGVLKQNQVDGINTLLDAAPHQDIRWLAYELATTFHETGEAMTPVEEQGRGRGLAYGRPAANGKVYYGRGYVQLTWEKNYEAMSKVVGVDLVAIPEAALEPEFAAKILFYGMENGSFTGHKLSDYLNDSRTDFVNSRRIINGTDRAYLVAGYATAFLTAITKGLS